MNNREYYVRLAMDEERAIDALCESLRGVHTVGEVYGLADAVRRARERRERAVCWATAKDIEALAARDEKENG